MTRGARELGEPASFGNEKCAADREGGHDCPHSDEQPRFCPAEMLTRHQDEAGGDEDNCRRSEDGLPDCFGVDGESIGHRIRGRSAHVAGNDLEGERGADPRGGRENVQGQEQLIDAHPRNGNRGEPSEVAPFVDPVVCVVTPARDDRHMASDSAMEPPAEVWYALDEALTLLAALEDGRDALIESGHLAVVLSVEAEIRLVSRKLGFRDPEGGSDAD